MLKDKSGMEIKRWSFVVYCHGIRHHLQMAFIVENTFLESTIYKNFTKFCSDIRIYVTKLQVAFFLVSTFNKS